MMANDRPAGFVPIPQELDTQAKFFIWDMDVVAIFLTVLSLGLFVGSFWLGLVRDIKEDMGFLMPILVEMTSPNDGLSDFLFSVLQTHVLHCLDKARRSGKTPEITDLVDSLKTGFADPEDRTGSPDPRIQDLAVQLTPYSREGVYGHYFCGTSSVNFTSNFIVLELEGLKSRKSLQSVVLLCLIFLITQDLTAGDKHIRKMVVIDEAWDLLSHKHAASFIENG